MSKTSDRLQEISKAWKEKNGRGKIRFGKISEVRAGLGGFISTGLIGFDMLLGGGIQRGRATQFVGPADSGKTTTALQVLAHARRCQVEGGYIDIENAINRSLAKAMGLDVDDIAYGLPESGEDAMDMALVGSANGVDLMVIDSIGAFTSEAKVEKEDLRKSMPAARARLVGDFITMINPKLASRNQALILLNHETGTMKTDFYGNPIKTEAGGEKLKYMVGTTVRFSQTGKVLGPDGKPFDKEKHKDPWAVVTNVHLKRSKLALRERSIELLNILGQGYSVLHDLVETAITYGLIQDDDSWFTLPGEEKRIHGKSKLMARIGEDPELQKALRDTLESMIPPYSDHGE